MIPSMKLVRLTPHSSLDPYSHAVEGTYTHPTKTRFVRSFLPCRDYHGNLHHSLRGCYGFLYSAGAVLALSLERHRKQYR